MLNTVIPSLRPTVLHLAQSDIEGGAGKAAFRLHQELQEIGVNSIFHPGRSLRVGEGLTPARRRGVGLAATRMAAFANALILRTYPKRQHNQVFSSSLLSYGRPKAALVKQADVICLHWIAGAFLRPAQIARLKKPLVWRLSDLWPFTGGCHYPGSCCGFETSCGTCPTLGSMQVRDLSSFGYRQRERAYRDIDLTVVAPSRWIAEKARRSSLFSDRRVVHIPTGIKLNVFYPRDRETARARFGLPQDAHIILFGALGALLDPRKGFPDCVRTLEAWAPSCGERPTVLVVFGGGGDPPHEVAGVPVRDVGRLNDPDALADLYSAADVLLAPFKEDNLPNVVLEAIACGTPAAAYAVGGIPDAVIEGRSGALAPPGDASALAAALDRTLAQRQTLTYAARSTAEETFDLRRCAKAYARLISELADLPTTLL